MIGKGHCYTMGHGIGLDLFVQVKYDASIAFEDQLIRVDFPECAYQVGAADKVHGVRIWLARFPVDADRAAAFGFGSDITGFSPLQGFF